MNKQLNTPPFRPMSTAARELRRRHLVAHVAAAGSPRHRRTLLVTAVAVFASAVLAAAAYGAYTLTRVPSHMQLLSVACYAQDSLAAANTTVQSDHRSPAEACAATWATSFPTQPQPAVFSACLLDGGAIAVFPDGDSTCERLGLAPFSGQNAAAAEAARSATLLRAIDEEVNTTTCLSSDVAQRRVEATLASHDFNDWRVVVAGGQAFTADKCATTSINAGSKTITVVPR
jgi:hypothetical protein